MAQVTRRIVVMRHSQAEQSGVTDFERALTDRGIADARAAGRWLVGRSVDPDHALVSGATRTRQTWEAVAEEAGWDVEAVIDEGLYDAGPQAALDLMCETPDTVRTLMVVGHNPTMVYLAQMLDDGEGDEQASNDLSSGYPTSAMTVFDFQGEWSDLDEQAATVTAYGVGRG